MTLFAQLDAKAEDGNTECDKAVTDNDTDTNNVDTYSGDPYTQIRCCLSCGWIKPGVFEQFYNWYRITYEAEEINPLPQNL